MSLSRVNQFPAQAVANGFCIMLKIPSFFWKEKALNEKNVMICIALT